MKMIKNHWITVIISICQATTNGLMQKNKETKICKKILSVGVNRTEEALYMN